MEYLTCLDLSENVDIVALTKLNFELSEREDEILLTTSKNTVYKILKVILYHIGLIKGKLNYEMQQIEQRIDSKFRKNVTETEALISQLKAFKDTSLFEMQEFQTKIVAVNASVGAIKRKQDQQLKVLQETMEASLSR